VKEAEIWAKPNCYMDKWEEKDKNVEHSRGGIEEAWLGGETPGKTKYALPLTWGSCNAVQKPPAQ